MNKGRPMGQFRQSHGQILVESTMEASETSSASVRVIRHKEKGVVSVLYHYYGSDDIQKALSFSAKIQNCWKTLILRQNWKNSRKGFN